MSSKLILERLDNISKFLENLSENADIVQNIENIEIEIVSTYQNKNKVILFGNGGSAADAQHIAAELLGKFRIERTSLPALALTTNSSVVTALSNDYSYSEVFIKQLEGLATPGDLVIGISTSGNSVNVVEGLGYACENELTTVGLTGQNGGKLEENSKLCIKVPSKETPRIQEAHIVIGHIICEMVEQELFGS